MKLTEPYIEEFYRFFFSEESAEQIAAKANALRERLSAGTDSLDTRFVWLSDGKIAAMGSVSKWQDQVYGLSAKMSPANAAEGFRHILEDTFTFLQAAGAKKLSYRAKIEPSYSMIQEVLLSFGFRQQSERVEYHSPIASLPLEDGTPLVWKPMPDKSEGSFRGHAEILRACAQGDPDFLPEDNPYDLLKEYLADSSLTGAASCVQVGHLVGKPAAIAVAQVNPVSGWSRITYMGVLPEFRGRGLGRWVHRHGFAMMREQGGRDYHGGTLVINEPMRKLFEMHGCTETQRLVEWSLDLADLRRSS